MNESSRPRLGGETLDIRDMVRGSDGLASQADCLRWLLSVVRLAGRPQEETFRPWREPIEDFAPRASLRRRLALRRTRRLERMREADSQRFARAH
jgi:hypothetical protein